jgi:ATP-grasp in the biosynthetic pathway with Ter operon
MSKVRLWMSAAFPVSFYHINALSETGKYEIHVSHHQAHMPYLQNDVRLSEFADLHRFQEPVFDNEAAYLDWCLSYCQQENIQLFIPGRLHDIFAAKIRAFRAIGTHVMVAATAKTLRLLNNKIHFLESIEDLNIPISPWLSFTSRTTFNHAWRKLGAGKKHAVGVYGSGFWRLTRHKSYLHQYNRFMIDVDTFRKRLDCKVRKPALLMAYCEGAERSVDCVCYQGNLLYAFIRKKSKHVQIVEEYPLLIEYVRRLIARFKLSGIINIQFKDLEEKPCVLEINPRASAGSVMAYQAGVNIMPLAVEAYLQKGQLSSPLPSISIGQSIARSHLYFTVQTASSEDMHDIDDTLSH